MSELSRSSKLKSLRTKRNNANDRLDQLSTDVKVITERLDALNAQYKALASEVKGYENEITELTKPDKTTGVPTVVTVSEHAILRYVQLAMGLDMEQVAQSILTETFKRNVMSCNGNVSMAIDGPESLKAVVKNHVVVTIMPSA